MEKKRESYLDIAKGIGIILVILGHIDIGPLNTWVYSFDLPLFYIVAGICFHYRDKFTDYLKAKSRRCLIPYCFFGIIIALVESKTGYLYNTGLIDNLKRLATQMRYSTLWFLATLFIASLLFYAIVKICRQNSVAILTVSIILSIIFVELDQYLIRALPWNLDTAFIVLGFMAIGYFLKNRNNYLDRLFTLNGLKKGLITIAFLLLNVAFYIANMLVSGYSLEMYWNSYGIYPFMYLAALFGTLFVLMLSHSISFRPLESLGRNSMTYFALHQSAFLWPFTLLLRKIGLIKFKMTTPENILSKVILFVLIMIACTIVDRILRSTKLSFLLGE